MIGKSLRVVPNKSYLSISNLTKIPKGRVYVRNGGKCIYRHRLCSQVVGFEQVLAPFFSQLDIRNVFEIGTQHGGFTLFLSDVFPSSTIYTYDVVDQSRFLENVSNVKRSFRNIFNKDYTIASNQFTDLISKTSPTLVLCDGGNKIEEVKTISKLLKIGDYIMWHDYAEEPLKSELKEKGTWVNFEIDKQDIESDLISNGFEFVHQELQHAVWGCAQKVR